jgi:hypothetical protein
MKMNEARRRFVMSTFAISMNYLVGLGDKTELLSRGMLAITTCINHVISFDQPPQRGVAYSSCNPKQEVASL